MVTLGGIIRTDEIHSEELHATRSSILNESVITGKASAPLPSLVAAGIKEPNYMVMVMKRW